MHEFKRFIQQQLDARGWKQADLVRASGLSRSHVSKLMRDDREHLGQMPEADTLAGLARGFTIPEEIVRTAASRALVGYEDDGHPIHPRRRARMADTPGLHHRRHRSRRD